MLGMKTNTHMCKASLGHRRHCLERRDILMTQACPPSLSPEARVRRHAPPFPVSGTTGRELTVSLSLNIIFKVWVCVMAVVGMNI